MKKEFALAFSEVLDDKQLPQEVVVEAIEAAMVSAYRKTVNASNAQQVLAKIDLETGGVLIYAEKEVVEDVQDPRTEVDLETARKEDPEAELGGIVVVESTPEDFGRVAAQTARQVIQQRIREAERQVQYDYFHKREGEIVNGIVQAVNPYGITLGLDRKAEGIMPRNHQIRGERFRVHDRVRALLYEVKMTPRGPQITLSRAHRDFLRRLLEDEVPEIYHGLVEVRAIAREPGFRSKVAVYALQPGIEPVGACVGIRGVRIQAIVRELNDEKIDVIEWNPDPAAYIAKALSPARVTGVYLDETAENKTATVIVPEDQLSLAIGRDGQNARLAAKLTSWRIDIKSLPEATSDALHKLQTLPQFAAQAEAMAEDITKIEAILTKKAEGRPVTPEEYQLLAKFVDSVEGAAAERREAKLEAKRAMLAEAKDEVPVTAFDIPLDELGISPRYTILLTGEGYSTIGDLMLQLAVDPDVILAVNGVGPKTMENIETALAEFEFPEPPEPEAPEEVAEAEAEVEVEAEAAPEEVAEAEPEAVAEAEAGEAVEEETEEPEETPEPVAAQKSTKAKPAGEPEAEEAEPETSLEEIFARSAQRIRVPLTDDDEPGDLVFLDDDKGAEAKPAKKGKKKKKYRQIEYDPDKDVTIVHRKRKREEGGEWDDEF